MILGVRHGERGDRSPSEMERKRVELYFDCHLTEEGALQAQLTGKEIQRRIIDYESSLLQTGRSSGKKIIPIILTSPFLRTIQTAYQIASSLDCIYENTIFIQDELIELLWNGQEFDIDPLPLLFSRTRKLEDFARYGLDFQNSKIKLGKDLFKSKDFLYPKYPESLEACQERIAIFCSKIQELFFKNFKYNEYVLIWVSHQYCLACAIWHLTGLRPDNFNDDLVELCGILDIRYEDPDKDLEKYKVIQKGTHDHLKVNL